MTFCALEYVKMLTRHFYDLEEVGFALLDSLRYKRSEEAIFWAREILLSEEKDVLNKIMVQAWILYMGAKRIDWLDAWFHLDSDKLLLVNEFCKRDSNGKGYLTFWIACRGLSPVASEERITLALAENDPICLYWWLGPLYDKKPSAIINTISGFVDSPDIFNSLQKAMATTISLQLRILLSVCAVQVLCLTSFPEPLISTDNDFVKKLVDTWSVGRRSSRIFTIKPEHLPHGYKRSLQKDTLCVSAIKIMANGCIFWKSIEALIKDDISQEQIIDKYFPDDIPDEWSISDRAKSHPINLDEYFVHIKHEYRLRLNWNPKRVPFIYNAWRPTLTLLFKACSVPDR